MIVACWNAAWHSSRSWQGKAISQRILASGAEIVCIPECQGELLEGEWHVARSETNYGYPIVPGRSKVTLWSRNGWRDIERTASRGMPGGRFVAATTATSLGAVRVIGVCVPWYAAHVSTGRRDRRPWEDHIAYLKALAPPSASSLPLIMLGDFNQAVPNRRAPAEAVSLLETALADLTVHTSGVVSGLSRPSVCHIASTRPFVAAKTIGIAAETERGPLSDHDGLIVEFDLRVPA
ncbi:endonuclease/exonuclease/phosphatase family protein [Arsenicitalea aurantiaca]|uniref:Endonuclease/exonuclease/phosphatase family protein n=1 Tax=Arsenicitalea aurantiaca TaxID=1783274 RepID=A0A433XEF1_9HYPH|nr:endonuclease/exonuclease/phosphatase family protein [Arsenicitalea aurantiaca]RUT32440.1 endonuclease/exonuclease/phosphatase family protein [Arsenicitalea aurantiaca]